MIERTLASFGASKDGQDNSRAFTAAAQALRDAGGGSLIVERGIWRTGPLELGSHTTLVLEAGALISFIPEPEQYPPVYTRWEGVECFAMHPLVFAQEQHHIRIIGKGGIDGSGSVWWELLREKRRKGQDAPETPLEQKLAALNPGYNQQPSGGGSRNMQFLRPPLIQFYKCTDILLDGITLTNSPFWTLHPLFCDTLTLRNLVIANPPDAPNTDGMDIDSCRNVCIAYCQVSVGDDGIALKSGSGEDGIRADKPTAAVLVHHCTVRDGHGGIVIGSETAGGIFDVTVEDCVFIGTDRGIRIKTRRGRGGQIHDLRFRNLTMENNLCPLAINMYYRCGTDLASGLFSLKPEPVGPGTPSIKNICISGIQARGCRASAGFIAGLPESPVKHLYISDSDLCTDEMSGVSPDESDMFLGLPPVNEKSFRLLHVEDMQFTDVRVRGPQEAFIYR
ncbi:Glycosyl hydrolases family 28 [Hollandina sp. SP2]